MAVDVLKAFGKTQAKHHAYNLGCICLVKSGNLLEEQVSNKLILCILISLLFHLFQSESLGLSDWLNKVLGSDSHRLRLWHLGPSEGCLLLVTSHVWECLLVKDWFLILPVFVLMVLLVGILTGLVSLISTTLRLTTLLRLLIRVLLVLEVLLIHGIPLVLVRVLTWHEPTRTCLARWVARLELLLLILVSATSLSLAVVTALVLTLLISCKCGTTITWLEVVLISAASVCINWPI